jgi:hypothetical protein
MLSPASLQNGETHAALNFAAVYKAQSVFVARGEMYDDVRLAEVADAWGMWVSEVDGNDAVAVYGAMKEACERARKGKGPVLLDARVHQPCPETRQALAAEVRSNGLDADEIDETVRKRVEGALEAARGGGPVGDETLFEAVFSTRPWFLR